MVYKAGEMLIAEIQK